MFNSDIQNRMSDTFFSDTYRRRSFPISKMALFGGAAGLLILSALHGLFWRPPASFPESVLFTVREGMTLTEAAQRLRELQVVRSPFWFKTFGILWGGERGLKAGEYQFAEPLSLSRIAWRVTHGFYALLPIKVTIPEGYTNREIAAVFEANLPTFNDKLFLKLARDMEGFLFPDTYLILPGMSEKELVEMLFETYKKRTAELERKIAASGKSEKEIIIMASIVEEEARTDDTRRKIAGILWKRLKEDMPLQVDAVFPYIFAGKRFDLMNGDLEVDSPYNTYTNKGLPKGPITNPGLASIQAALEPVPTPYWYYLSDLAGNMYYARTHEAHLANRDRYLNK
ncbi:MAG: endolytic transglycosylase MltG [bacterium]|nr:endolytic transglycosylase MltG [bacterium]